MNLRTLIMNSLLGVLAAGAAVTAVPGTDAAPVATAEPVASTSCTSNYHAGVQSVDMTIENTTGQVLTLDPAHTGRADIGHWGSRPLTTLQPGQCEELTGYSDSPLGDFYLTATYRLPDGTYLPFSVDSGSDTVNRLVFTASGMSGIATGDLSGQQDFAWTISNPTSTGTMHVHDTLTAQAA